MSTGRRILSSPIAIGAGIAIVAAIAVAAAWATKQPKDESPLRRRLGELGVIATLDGNGQSIGSVNFATLKDKTRFPEALEIVLQLKNITSLNLNTFPITNDDLKEIAQLSSLVTLSLNECKIGGGFEPLSNLGNLQYLHLAETQTTNDDLRSLGGISSLVSVDLSRTKVENGLSPLSQLQSLKWVLFNGNSLNDGALAGLSTAPSLTRISLIGAEYLDGDLQALQSAQPHIVIDK